VSDTDSFDESDDLQRIDRLDRAFSAELTSSMSLNLRGTALDRGRGHADPYAERAARRLRRALSPPLRFGERGGSGSRAHAAVSG